jgi:hypothetical protein
VGLYIGNGTEMGRVKKGGLLPFSKNGDKDGL